MLLILLFLASKTFPYRYLFFINLRESKLLCCFFIILEIHSTVPTPTYIGNEYSRISEFLNTVRETENEI